MILPNEAHPLLFALGSAFTAPTSQRLATLMAAAILTTGCRTVANLLRTLGGRAPGKPVLATWVGGMAQFLAEACDRLRDSCSPPVTLAAPTAEALAEGLRERLAAGGDKAGADARSLVLRDYSWAEAARRYARVFAEP
jgi:glycosyltransferase involved in cell wall biosynthesis